MPDGEAKIRRVKARGAGEGSVGGARGGGVDGGGDARRGASGGGSGECGGGGEFFQRTREPRDE